MRSADAALRADGARYRFAPARAFGALVVFEMGFWYCS
jgi:hypothetical protein